MTILESLMGLGFKEASVVNEQKDTLVVRVWTTKGWAYERFDKAGSADAVTAWAKGKEPGK